MWFYFGFTLVLHLVLFNVSGFLVVLFSPGKVPGRGLTFRGLRGWDLAPERLLLVGAGAVLDPYRI